MNCQDFLRLLDQDRSIADADARAHLLSCADCRRAWQRLEAVRRELGAMGEEEPLPPFLHARVMAHVRSGAPARRPWWDVAARPAWAGAALVALLLVAVSGYRFYQWLQPAPVSPRTSQRAEREIPAPLPEMRAAESPSEPKAAMPQASPALRQVAPSAGTGSKRGAEAARRTPMAGGFAPVPPGAAAGSAEESAQPPARQIGADVDTTSRAGSGADLSIRALAEDVMVRSAAAPTRPIPQQAMKTATKTGGYVLACELRSGASFVTRLLLAPADAPPPGASWSVVVEPDRSLAIRDAAGRQLPVRAAVAAAITAAHLQPGRYSLARIVF